MVFYLTYESLYSLILSIPVILGFLWHYHNSTNPHFFFFFYKLYSFLWFLNNKYAKCTVFGYLIGIILLRAAHHQQGYRLIAGTCYGVFPRDSRYKELVVDSNCIFMGTAL